jgi:hypothetical protein
MVTNRGLRLLPICLLVLAACAPQPAVGPSAAPAPSGPSPAASRSRATRPAASARSPGEVRVGRVSGRAVSPR